jgi:hypothetical protein
MQVFTIITTGLSDWGSKDNVILFYGIIMESLIMNTFFSKVAKLQVHHYDSNLTENQKQLIRDIDTRIFETYSIPLESEIYTRDLHPSDKTLQSIHGLDTRNCFHLDFANLDSDEPEPRDSFLSIRGQPIRKVYFGYWEPYPQNYADIIKHIKLMEINPDKSITTFADKMRDIGIKRPILFYSIPECEDIPKQVISEDIPKQVITIPGIRTMHQWGGVYAVELYKLLWSLPIDGMKAYITSYQEELVKNAFDALERIKANKTPADFCEFCPIRQCLKTKFRLNDSRPHPRLCGLCNRLTKETIGKEIMKNTPPVSV